LEKLQLKLSTGSSAMGITTMLRRPLESARYAASAYSSQLAELGAIASMSRKGCCYDNVPMESFFHTLKVELVRQRRWNTHDEARRDLLAYIEGYYNRQRIHSAIGYVTPEQAQQMAA
jgi:putative transposase